MMGTWTSVLYHPLVYKIVEDVFASKNTKCCETPGHI